MTEHNAEKKLPSQNGAQNTVTEETRVQAAKIHTNPKTLKQFLENDQIDDALKMYESFLNNFDDQLKMVVLKRAELTNLKVGIDLEGLSHLDADQRLKQIRSQIWDQIIEFRRTQLDDIFDFRSRSKIIKEIESRDQFLHEILDIRLEPKRYKRDILSEEDHQKLKGEDWFKSKSEAEVELSRQTTSQMTESGWYMLHRIKNMDTGRLAVATIIKTSSLNNFMINQIKILCDLRHRNVIKILDSETSLFPFYVISEYVKGKNLSKLLRTVGHRSVWQAADWIYQITDAMEYLRNKRILHVSPRPSNIFVDDEWNIMVSPFDLILQDQMENASKNNDNDRRNEYEQSLSQFQEICQYGSPELLLNDGRPLNTIKEMCNSDLYSIGLLAFKILTAKDLFDGKNISEILEKRRIFRTNRLKRFEMLEPVKKFGGLYKIIIRLLEKDPQTRSNFFKGGGLHELLREIRQHITTDIKEGSEAQKSYRRCLIYNKNIIKEFYENLFKKHPNFQDDFTEITQKRQHSMLQMAIDLLLDLENRKEEFKTLIHKPNSKHKKYSPDEFELFIDTLIETIEQNDTEIWENPVKKAWNEVRNQTITFIREVRPETD